MFTTLRVILWLIILGVVILKIQSMRIYRKKLVCAFAVFISTILLYVSGMFPIENVFINFKAPESVFKYTCSGEIEDIVTGEESCMVIYSTDDDALSWCIIPKTKDGYKIPGYFRLRRVFHKFDESGSFDVYSLAGINDCYIIGNTRVKRDNIEIVDSNDASMEKIIREWVGEVKLVTLYGFIKDYTEDYFLTVNGEKIEINEKDKL